MDSNHSDLPGLSQSRLYRDVLRRMGRDVAEIGEPGGGPVSGQVLTRRLGPFGRVALVPGGLRWSHAPSARALEDLLGKADAAWIIVNCVTRAERAAFRQVGAVPLISERHDARIDLTADRGTRLGRMHQKWRNRLRHARGQRLDLRHAAFCETRDSWFLAAETAQRRHRGYKALPLDFLRVAARHAPAATRLFVASRHGTPTAAMLFLRHEGAATYHIGFTTEAGRRQSAHALLMWEACNWLAEQGDGRLDLGPVDTHRNPGLARFKLGSGAVPVPVGETHLCAAAVRPMARLAARFTPRSASHAAEGRNGRSCR